jgi:hypothetical protein
LFAALVFVLAVIFCAYPAAVKASAGPVVFSEINWAGSKSSTADEWLELINVSNAVIDLTNWSVWNTVSEPKQLVVISAGTISPNGTFLIANNGPDYQFSLGSSTLAAIPDVIDSSISLSNSALKLELRDSAGQVVDVAGDGSKPSIGSIEPIASMERLLSPIGAGDIATSWRTMTSRTHLDQDTNQQGTPTPSGNAIQQIPPPTVLSSTSSPVNPERSAMVTNLQAVVQNQVTGTVRVQGTVSVAEQSYQSRTAVLADGTWSVELSLPTSSSLKLEQGDQITIIATVSRGSTPKLLLASDADVLTHEHSQDVNLLQLNDIDRPALFQLLHLRGLAHPARGVLELSTSGYTFHVTRKQGVSLPAIKNQDTVELTGLVVALDPLTVRILSNDSLTVTATLETNTESVSSDDIASDSTDSANVSEEQASDVTETTLRVSDANLSSLDSVVPLAVADQTVSVTDSLLQSTVLGARNSRKASPLERVSWYTAIVSACVILTLLGDSLWLRLKHKQQQ